MNKLEIGTEQLVDCKYEVSITKHEKWLRQIE
jgi:hypothetical protein